VVLACVGFSGSGLASGEADPEARSTPLFVDSCVGVADGALCNDQNTCTLRDSCTAGKCVGVIAADGTACTDGNQCTSGDICTAAVCHGVPVADGTACTDGEPCTDPDSCLGGACASGPVLTCDDGDMCTQDSCNPGEGCHNDPLVPCPDGGVDAAPMDAQPIDAEPPDAIGTEDAVDDASPDLPTIYQAQGGACVCSTAGAPRSATVLGLLVAAMFLSLRRKKNRR
jgi:MYXO-CTERM domain-containing protein